MSDRAMYRLSWSQALFVGEPVEVSLDRLARFGYDGVELPFQPTPPERLAALLETRGLACFSINGSFIGEGRDLSSSDEEERTTAVAYVGKCMEFAAALGAETVIVVPTRIGKRQPDTTLDAEWANVVRSLRDIAVLGETFDVTAVIECVNRSETYFANRLATARRLIEAVASPHVAAMADVFHMNIEESNLIEALNDIAPYLRHVHLADNNRMAPGMGHLDLTGFLGKLERIGYRGPLTMECDVQVLDRYGRAAASTASTDFDAYAEAGAKTLRRIQASLRSNT